MESCLLQFVRDPETAPRNEVAWKLISRPDRAAYEPPIHLWERYKKIYNENLQQEIQMNGLTNSSIKNTENEVKKKERRSTRKFLHPVCHTPGSYLLVHPHAPGIPAQEAKNRY